MTTELLGEKIPEKGIVKLIDEYSLFSEYTKKVSGVSIEDIEKGIDYDIFDFHQDDMQPLTKTLIVQLESLKYYHDNIAPLNLFDKGYKIRVFGYDKVPRGENKYDYPSEDLRLKLGYRKNKAYIEEINQFIIDREEELEHFGICLDVDFRVSYKNVENYIDKNNVDISDDIDSDVCIQRYNIIYSLFLRSYEELYEHIHKYFNEDMCILFAQDFID